VAGWQAGGRFTAQSGATFTVNLASDHRSNVLTEANDGPHTSQQWFNTDAGAL